MIKDIENSEFKRAENFEEEIKMLQNAAKNFTERVPISLRISKYDLNEIRRIANLEGLSYQTFINSVLHKIVNGKINIH